MHLLEAHANTHKHKANIKQELIELIPRAHVHFRRSTEVLSSSVEDDCNCIGKHKTPETIKIEAQIVLQMKVETWIHLSS